MAIKHFKETKAYRLAYVQAMDIFEVTRQFPKEETYSLTIKFEELPEAFVQTWPKLIGKKLIVPISFRKHLTATQKIQKQISGLIFLYPVTTSLRKFIVVGSAGMKRLEGCYII